MKPSEFEQIKQEIKQLRNDQKRLFDRIEQIEEKLNMPNIERTKSFMKKNEIPSETLQKETKLKQHNDQQKEILKRINVKKHIEKDVPYSNMKDDSNKNEDKDLELKIGGTWLNRIGVIAVIFGLGFFLKYSFENQWIGPTGRVILGILTGLVMLIGGEKLRHRYPGYAQGLLGGGSLALFFSIYSSYAFYDLISPIFAFLFLTLVMINTVFMAVRHDSLPIGILGIIGGYATPFMVGSDDPSLWTLNSYLILLTAGVLGVSIYKKWSSFQYLSFVFNQFIFAVIWIDMFWWGQNQFVWSQFLFLISLFAFYLGVATVYNIRKRIESNRFDIGLIILNAFSFFMWSLVLLENTFLDDYLGFYAVFLALVYIYLGKMAYRVYSEDKAQVYSLFVVSFMLVTVAIPLQFSKEMLIGLAWLAEAIGLTYMAKKLNRPQIIYGSFIVFVLGLFVTYQEMMMISVYKTFLINVPTLLLISSIVTMILIMNILKKMEQQNLLVTNLVSILKGAILFFIFVTLTVENRHYFYLTDPDFFLSPEQLSLSSLWLIYAIVLFIFGLRKNIRYLRYAALGLLAIVIVKGFFFDLAQLATMFKILLFIFLGLCLLGISYLYQKKKDSLIKKEE